MQPSCHAFAEYVHQRRRDLKIPLREFCQKYGFDAGLISKIEQGIYPARALTRKQLWAYSAALRIQCASVEWEDFWRFAQTSEPLYPNGPSDKDLLGYLPIFSPLTTQEIAAFLTDLRKELTYAE